MSHRVEKRINELKDAISTYSPGSTFRLPRDRPTEPPIALRIGLFGPTGVGKSALINSMNYATGPMWENRAPEGFAIEASKTLTRNAFPMTEKITMVDNRGMRSLGGPFMVELGHQIAGVYNDEQSVEWDHGFLRRVVAGLERTFRAKVDCEIHCAVLVISALNLSLRATDLKELIEQIKSMTGMITSLLNSGVTRGRRDSAMMGKLSFITPSPIVIITHRRHHEVREEVIIAFRTGLQQQRIDYVYELENYTTDDHGYDAEKHLVLLEALYQCAIVGDKVMKYKESNQGCTIL
ncbi:uncharacterized protein LOC115923871 [Strongylocentrotus purpuratus]|uniref:G domain-containing protein n=1 Tax=Strongylocentrotus purpuratus TaxID=7668 RepID=A0A7M7NSV3_STRPU|nr:uncharacterized protein LOC115923871 [Strongylocentrotus purpuratus]